MYRANDETDSQTRRRVITFNTSDLKKTDIEVLVVVREHCEDAGPIQSVKIMDRHFKTGFESSDDELVIEVGINYHYLYGEE